MRRSLRRTFFRPEWPTLTSRSLQSITRPFQKRFRQVFGNALILIFYLSLKAWEEKSLPKCHLGWFFLVFGEGKATKENMSIFWFIWPLNTCSYKKFNEHACLNFFIMVLSYAWFFFSLKFLMQDLYLVSAKPLPPRPLQKLNGSSLSSVLETTGDTFAVAGCTCV